MRVSRLNASLLLLLLTFLSLTITARAARVDDDDDQPDDYDVKARVVRISMISGEANLKRDGIKDWELVQLNYPLVEGDTVATGKDSRIEVQFDSRNFVRLSENTVLRIVTLRDEGTALSVVEGTVIVRLAKFDRDKRFFEVDAPRSTLAAEKAGHYRIDVPREGRVRLTVRDGGSARIYSDTSGFSLRDGRSAELVVTGPTPAIGICSPLVRRRNRSSGSANANARSRNDFVPTPNTSTNTFGAPKISTTYGEWTDSKRIRLDLASTCERDQRLQRLGAVSLRSLDVGAALWLDVGWLRTVGLGAVSLRPLGLLQQWMGMGAAQPV